MMVDPLANVLAALKNGSMRGLDSIEVPASDFIHNNLKLLEREGYIGKVSEKKSKEGKTGLYITVNLLYTDGHPVFKEAKKVSKSSLRVHGDVGTITSKQNATPQKLYVVSTNKGVMSATDAIEKNIGGEILYVASKDHRKSASDDAIFGL